MLGADAFIISTELQSVFTRLGESEEGGGETEKDKDREKQRQRGGKERQTNRMPESYAITQSETFRQANRESRTANQTEREREGERER